MSEPTEIIDVSPIKSKESVTGKEDQSSPGSPDEKEEPPAPPDEKEGPPDEEEGPSGSTDVSQQTSREGSNASRTSSQEGHRLKMTESVRRIIVWTMTGFFDWNPRYFIQIRGLLNILHICLSLTTLVLLSTSCQLRPFPEASSEGFFCKPPETFLFVTSVCAFLTSVLYLFCCMLSKRTDALLFETSFEISYFILYFILLLTASIALMISAINWEQASVSYDINYQAIQTASIVALLNSIIYGISAIFFFISHRYYHGPAGEASRRTTENPPGLEG